MASFSNYGMFLLWVFLATCFDLTVQASPPDRVDMHTSPTLIAAVFKFDKLVGQTLGLSPFPLKEADGYLKSYGWLVADAKELEGDVGHPSLTGHPLHLYALFKRVVLFYPEIQSIFHEVNDTEDNVCEEEDTSCKIWSLNDYCQIHLKFMIRHCPKSCGLCKFVEGIREVNRAEKEVLLPTFQDFLGMSNGLAQLNRIYDINIGAMRNGSIYGRNTSVVLDTLDCMQIADANFKDEYYAIAWYWYLFVTQDPGFKNETHLHGIVDAKMREIGREHDRTLKNDDRYFAKPLRGNYYQRIRLHYIHPYCKGYVPQNKVETGLTCEFTTKGNPFHILQPFKQERLRTSPELYIIYDMISDAEIETLKNLSQGRLVKDTKPKRRAETTYLYPEDHPVVSRLNRRAAAVSGLQMVDGSENPVDADPLKIRNYGTCGDLGLHTDTRYKHKTKDEYDPEFPEGERLGTVIYYMSDAELGGNTAFPEIGATVPSRKGTASLFYNLKRNGKHEDLTVHSSCPIIFGTKWVALKWFREKYNFLTRKCTLNEDE